MRNWAAWLAVLVLAVAPGAARAGPAEDLAAILADHQAYVRQADPIRAGSRGDLEALARWPDDTPAAIAARGAALAELRDRLEALDPAGLDEAGRLNRDLLLYRVRLDLETLTWDEARMPFISGEGFYTLPELTAAATAVNSEAEALAWIARLEALPAYYDVQIANMRRGIADGFTQPRITVETAVEVVAGLAAEPAAGSGLLAPLRVLPASIPPARQAELRARATAAVEEGVRPAQAALARFLADEYLPAARPELGASTLPDGAAYYAWLVRRHTTTGLTPDEIHALGISEIARIRAEMQAVMAEAGFDGTLEAFIAFLRTDPRFYAADEADLMEKTAEIVVRAQAALPRWFGTLPRLPLGITPRPPGLDSISTGYNPGSPELGVPGAVVLNLAVATRDPLHSLPSWTVHEGVPGHHLQIALAQERTDLPEFRRADDLTAYVEGWALYAERLGEEMGLYRDPYERFGRLSMEMWRACRLVMDTGIHAMGWTYDQAAACLRDNTALAPHLIEAETRRYIGWPGQALAYKVGELEILRLRRDAEARQGEAFDIRDFHDRVLGEGPMPLAVLAERIEAWEP